MVFMGMGDQDGIERPDIFPEHLLPEIRSAVDDNAFPFGLNHNGRT